MAKATGETEFITFGGFKHHCMGIDNVRFVYMGRGNVRFVSGHRFSDDASAAPEGASDLAGLSVSLKRYPDTNPRIRTQLGTN